MKVNLFDQNNFKCPDDEKMLLVFRDHVNSFPSLIEFGYACAFYEYQQDVLFHGQSWSQEYTWNDRKKLFNPIQINQTKWSEMKDCCIGELKEIEQVNLQGIFYDAYQMCNDWDLIFIIAQIGDFYYALHWSTSA